MNSISAISLAISSPFILYKVLQMVSDNVRKSRPTLQNKNGWLVSNLETLGRFNPKK